MKTNVTIETTMGASYEVEAYQPLYEFETTMADWTKAIVWGIVMPYIVYIGTHNALYMIGYILSVAGLYAISRKLTPAAVLLYAEAFGIVGCFIVFGSVMGLGAIIAAF